MRKEKRQKKRKWDKSKITNIILTILVAGTYGLLVAYGIWKYCCR